MSIALHRGPQFPSLLLPPDQSRVPSTIVEFPSLTYHLHPQPRDKLPAKGQLCSSFLLLLGLCHSRTKSLSTPHRRGISPSVPLLPLNQLQIPPHGSKLRDFISYCQVVSAVHVYISQYDHYCTDRYHFHDRSWNDQAISVVRNSKI